MGEIYRLKNDKPKAKEMFKTALSLKPDYADSLTALKELEAENADESGKWYKRLGKLMRRR
jgi:hypothetical protein